MLIINVFNDDLVIVCFVDFVDNGLDGGITFDEHTLKLCQHALISVKAILVVYQLLREALGGSPRH